MTAIAIIMEPVSWILDTRVGLIYFIGEYISNFLLVQLAPAIAGVMLSYADYKILKSMKHLRKRHFYMHPFMLTNVLLIVNIFTPIYFHIDPELNQFQSGPYQSIGLIITTLMYFYMVFLVYKYRSMIPNYVRQIFVVFFMIPIVFSFLQMLDSKLFFSWSSIALSLWVVFIFLETESGERDYLTKLFNRKSYENYVNHLIDQEKKFSVYYMDLDEFKAINDNLGHVKGDLVLIEYSKALQKAFSPNKLIARLGGDEFIAIDEHQLDETEVFDKLYAILEKSDDLFVQTLTCSYGKVEHQDEMTQDDIYVDVDRNLSIQKASKKNTRS